MRARTDENPLAVRHLMSHVSSKQPKLGLTQELFFSRIIELHTFVEYYTSPAWHRHQIKRATDFWCLFRKTQANVAVGGIEPPSPRLTVRRSTARQPLPTWRLSWRRSNCFHNFLGFSSVNLDLHQWTPKEHRQHFLKIYRLYTKHACITLYIDVQIPYSAPPNNYSPISHHIS